MAKELIARLPGWGGGSNIRDAPNQLGSDEAIAIVNMILEERGGASKRRGSTAVATLGGRIISAYPFYRVGLEPQVIVHTSDGKLQYATSPFTSWTDITTGLSTTEPFCFETFNSKCYMSNGVDNYCAWTGSAFQTFAALPKGRFIRLWKDTMWVSGVDATPDRVHSSDPGNAEVFGAAAWVDIGKGDGDSHKAIHTDGQVLIVWKQRRTFVIYDPVEFTNRVVDFEKGAESHFGVVLHSGRIYFLSRRGICLYLGDAPSPVLSGKIEPIFTPDVLELSKMNMAYAYAFGNRVGWTLVEKTQTVPTLQVEFYPLLPKTPFTFHRMPARCFAVVRRSDEERLFYGKTTANKVLEGFKGGTEDGTAFVGAVEGGWLDLGNPTHRKYLRMLQVVGRGKFFIGVKKDFSTGVAKTITVDLTETTELWNEAGDLWDDGIWGPAELLKIDQVHPDVYARWVSLRFHDGESSEGSRPFDVGDVEYITQAGQYAVFEAALHGVLMGDRL